jgi:hypothetical protein
MNTDEKIITKADVRFEKTRTFKITSGIIVFILFATILGGFGSSHILHKGALNDDGIGYPAHTQITIRWYDLGKIYFSGYECVYETQYYTEYKNGKLQVAYKDVPAGYEYKSFVRPDRAVVPVLLLLISVLLIPIEKRILKHESKITSLSISDSTVYGSYNRFLVKKKLNMPIDKIDNLTVMTGFFDKIRSGATVGVCSASGIIKVHFVQNAEEVVSAALARIEELRAKTKKEQPVVQPVAPAQSTAADKLKDLSVMKEQGLITDEEFNNKREKILKNM